MTTAPDPDDEETPATPDSSGSLASGIGVTTTVGFYRTTPDGELVDANAGLLEMFGCRTVDELSQHQLAAFHLDGRPEDLRRETIDRTGSARAMSATYRRADGSPIHVRESVSPVRDEDGDIRWYQGTMEDVTDLVRAHREMAEANDRLRRQLFLGEATLDAVGAGLLVLDLDGRVVDHNHRFLEIWEVPEAVLETGDAEAVLDIVYDRIVQPERSPGRTVPSPGIGEPASEVLELDDGRFVERSVHPREGRDGVVGEVWSFRDVTEDRRARRDLERSNEDLERFASAVSHDLREPMRTVTSFLHLLERRLGDDLDEDAGELLDHARHGAERASRMIESLLRLSGIGSRREPLAPTDLDAVLEEALDQLRLRIDETGADISAGDLPVVEGDADQLAELLQNLIDNAIKYGRVDGPPRIEIRAEEEGGTWTIRVVDDGLGMDEETAARAFDVFERGADAAGEGSGMGLAICRRIVDRHGGSIWIEETAPGEGATIALALSKVDETSPA